MFEIREERHVEEAVNEAEQRWPRADDVWVTITFVLMRDPIGSGKPYAEDGKVRSFEYPGARSIGMPSAVVIYRVEEPTVSVIDIKFFEAPYGQAGNA